VSETHSAGLYTLLSTFGEIINIYQRNYVHYLDFKPS